jgi:hypothetical protein
MPVDGVAVGRTGVGGGGGAVGVGGIGVAVGGGVVGAAVEVAAGAEVLVTSGTVVGDVVLSALSEPLQPATSSAATVRPSRCRGEISLTIEAPMTRFTRIETPETGYLLSVNCYLPG